jgi:membrane protein insertase Oxa1/YidC/SpoIIIJ
VWMGTLSSWKTASLFRNNVWIMGCSWFANLSTYSLAVILPWMVIMGLTEYCAMTLLPKTSQNLLRVSLLEPGILDCRLPWVFSKCKLFLM